MVDSPALLTHSLATSLPIFLPTLWAKILGSGTTMAFGKRRQSRGALASGIPKRCQDAGGLVTCAGTWQDGSMVQTWLVGGLEYFYDFPYIGNVIIPTDEVHHFSEG
jgi:hypothetical protein